MTEAASAPGGTQELPLAAEFPPASEEEWRRGVAKILAGRGGDPLSEEEFERKFERALVTHLHDGIRVPPLHTRDTTPAAAAEIGLPGASPYVRGSTAAGAVRFGWDVRQPLLVDPDDIAGTNEAALDELENGAASLLLRLPASRPSVDADTLARCFDGVELDLIALALDDSTLAGAVLDLWDRGGSPSTQTGSLGLDPVGESATDPATTEDRLEVAWPLIDRCSATFPLVRAIGVDGRPYHDAGGSDVEELGAAVATGVEYLRRFENRGVALDRAMELLEFRLVASADQFSTIAKLRAARRLWGRVAEAMGLDVAPRIHATMSWAMLTRYDPWVNLLRGTVAAMAAGVGGADAVTIEPYDVLHHDGRPSPLGRRMARNTQSILVEESNLARVIDPGGGSYYLEWLTDAMAREAWSWFQAIEAEGGMVVALGSGFVGDRIDATWKQRRDDIAHRRDPITGVSEFPNVHEDVPYVDPDEDETSTSPLAPRRRARDFEDLRARCDRHAVEHGARPVVVLAEIGTPADSTARSTFAKNLYESGGLEAVPWSVDRDGPDELARIVAERGAVIACLCSTDAIYPDRAADVVGVLRGAGITTVHLAGRAPEGSDIDGTISMGCNVLAVLRQCLQEADVR